LGFLLAQLGFFYFFRVATLPHSIQCGLPNWPVCMAALETEEMRKRERKCRG